jgi:hypothetical protein
MRKRPLLFRPLSGIWLTPPTFRTPGSAVIRAVASGRRTKTKRAAIVRPPPLTK